MHKKKKMNKNNNNNNVLNETIFFNYINTSMEMRFFPLILILDKNIDVKIWDDGEKVHSHF